MRRFDVAVIGLGYFSQFHLVSWQRLLNARLVGAIDLDAELCQQARSAFDIEVGQEFGPAISRWQPDIVDIVTPPSSHLHLIRELAGCVETIICQKPFCQSLVEAIDAVQIAENTGTRLIVHENFRFQPWHRAAGEAIREGMLGEIFQAHFALRPGDGRGHDAYLDRQPTFQTMPRFLVRETGVHFIDLFRYFAGDVSSVYADLRNLNPSIAGEDVGIMILEHESGARTVFDGNRLSDHASDNPRRTMGEMTIEGTTGTLRLDGSGVLTFRAFGSNHTTPLEPSLEVDEATFGGGCAHHLNAHIIAGLKGEGQIENEAQDYLHVLSVVEAAYQSAEVGGQVSVRD